MRPAAPFLQALLSGSLLLLGTPAQAQVVNGQFAMGAPGAPPPAPWVVTPYLDANGFTPETPQTEAGLDWTVGGSNLTYLLNGVNQPDPDLGAAASLRWPWTGNTCARVNFHSYNPDHPKNINVLSQTFTVDASMVDPADGLPHLRFVAAPVLQNPVHLEVQQPYCYYRVLDTVTQEVYFSELQLSAQPGVPWQKLITLGSEIDYTDWRLTDIPLPAATLTNGHPVKLELAASGCEPGGHFGELYVGWVGTTPPGLWAAAKADRTGVQAGANLTYSITVRNDTGSPVSGAMVTISTPVNTTFQAATPAPGTVVVAPPVGSTGVLVGTFTRAMAAGASATMTLTVQVQPGTTGEIVLGDYQIRSTQTTPLLGPTLITPLAVDTAVDTATTSASQPGCHQVAYTVTATNRGPAVAYGVQAVFTLPGGAAFVSSSRPATPLDSTHFSAALGDLAVNASQDVTFTAQLGDAGSSTGQVQASGNFTNLDPNHGSSSSAIATPGNLAFTAQPASATVLVGTPVTLTSAATPQWGTATCQWYQGSAPDTSVPATTGFSCPVATGSDGAFRFWARVSDACGSLDSGTATVTVFSTYNLGAAVTGGHGTASQASQAVTHGQPGSVQFAPADGYHLSALQDNASDVTPALPAGQSTPYTYTIPAMNGDHAVTASFALNQYTITLSHTGTGSISGDTTPSYGDTPSFSFTPGPGSRVANVLVDGVSVGAVASYPFPAIAASHTLQVAFDDQQGDFSVASVSDLDGTVLPTLGTVVPGAALTLAITPNRGHHLATLTLDGVPVGVAGNPGEYTLPNVQANHLVNATFAPNLFTLTLQPAANGTITVATPRSVTYGCSMTLTITPDPGYAIQDVLVDGISVGPTTTLTLPAIQADHTVSASFAAALPG